MEAQGLLCLVSAHMHSGPLSQVSSSLRKLHSGNCCDTWRSSLLRVTEEYVAEPGSHTFTLYHYACVGLYSDR